MKATDDKVFIVMKLKSKSNTRKTSLFGEIFIKHFNTIFNSKKIMSCICRAFRQGPQTRHVVKLIYFTLKFKTPFYLFLYEDMLKKNVHYQYLSQLLTKI